MASNLELDFFLVGHGKEMDVCVAVAMVNRYVLLMLLLKRTTNIRELGSPGMQPGNSRADISVFFFLGQFGVEHSQRRFAAATATNSTRKAVIHCVNSSFKPHNVTTVCSLPGILLYLDCCPLTTYAHLTRLGLG